MRSKKRKIVWHRVSLYCLFTSFVIASVTSHADPLENGFQNPPASARPQIWWHWMNGNITREGITADLEAMKRVGIGGAQIFNVDAGIPASSVKFMSSEWNALMLDAVKEADRLGLELCVHNCAGWSSSGGPWNTPEHAMQEVTTSELTIPGPIHFSALLPVPARKLGYYRDIAVLAFRASGIENNRIGGGITANVVLYSSSQTNAAPDGVIECSGIMDITSRLQADGRLDWDVPEGNWTILRLGYTPTGRENHPAPVEARGIECDKLSKEALDAHWAGFVQKVLDNLGPLAGKGKTLDNVLIDSYEVGNQSWTPQFREEFTRRRGYDPLTYLPSLTGRVVDSPEVTVRFLWDMRRTIADLFADNYYGHFQELCHQRGLQASFEPYTGPFESLQCGAKADIPMGEFWVGETPDSSIKLASSVGHIYGQPIIGAESFTARPGRQHGRWLEDAYSLKTVGDLVFCQGVNRLILHRYAMQPWTNRWPGMTMGQWGTHFDRTSTWWEQSRAWLQYLVRCQFLLQQGHFVADTAYFCGESAPVEMRVGDPPLPQGYDYDAIDADVLLHQASVVDGHLVLASGASYRALILPPSDRSMTPSLLRKLAGFVKDGLTVVGAPPQASPSLEDYPTCDGEVKSLVAQMWADCDGKAVTEHQFGKGRIVWGLPLAQVLHQLDLPPDFEYSNAAGANLAFIHRRIGETDVYFVSNQRTRYDTVECHFRASGRMPELWNPESGTIKPAAVWHQENGETVVPLSFDPAGSIFVIFRAKTPSDHLVAVQHKGPAIEEKRSKLEELHIVKAIYDAVQSSFDVTAEVKAFVAGGEHKITAGNDLAGDPAPGMPKRLRIDFLFDGRRQTAEAGVDQTVDLPTGCRVVKAVYGYFPTNSSSDVTAIVKALVTNGMRQIHVDNAMAGSDPAPNIVKQLYVEFILKGHKRTVEETEGGTLDLPAGATVERALYGQLRPETTTNGVDLTKKLAALVKHGELNVIVNNDLAGGDPSFGVPKELRVEYSVNGILKRTVVSEGKVLTLPDTGQPGGRPPPFVFETSREAQMQLLAWAPGKFTLKWASGRESSMQCRSLPEPLELTGPWMVNFPPGWGAPGKITLEHLQSWPEDSNPGVKYFSGTATYLKEFEVSSNLCAPGRELWLDLGGVKNFAEVTLNGKSFGILWKPPFHVNVTSAVNLGTNVLEIKVTNLWPNRLIGDEQLPPDCEWHGKRLNAWPQWLLDNKPSPTGRYTFATWHHWNKDDPLLDSGLLGPVLLRPVEELPVR